MKKLLIWGASGHARVVADMVRLGNDYELAAYVDDVSKPATELVDGVRVLRDRVSVLEMRDHGGVTSVVIAVGDCAARLRIAAWCRQENLLLATIVHPAAVVTGSASIGAGTVVMAGAIINAAARIGDNVIINTAVTVDHDCQLGEACHLSPGVHLAGRVRIGQATWLGIGVVVSDGLRIGSDTIVGAGSVVVRDIPDEVVAFGNPARVVRANTPRAS